MANVGVANLSLILGQSNAMTFSNIGVAYPGGWTTQSLNGGYAEVIWNIITQEWEQYVPGTNSEVVPSGSSAWGPEASIALARRALVPQRPSYFLKYAVGGVGLARDPNPSVNDWSPYSQGKAFGAAMAQLDAARASLAAYRFIAVDACYWIGNETDSNSSAGADMMRDLPSFVDALRVRCNAPDMKFIVARMKSGIGGAYTADVRAAQEYLGSLRRNAWVDTDDLTATAGHYDPASVVTIGDRMAQALEGIAG